MKDENRIKFREECLKRDEYKCIICGSMNKISVHHILERRLWEDGGYHNDNGCTLCEEHHIEAEKTNLSVEYLRERAGINKIILPEYLYDDQIYDKWGNIILDNGNRLKGELFFDESVQKIISDKLHLFIDYIKYPRTYHLPWSEGVSDDDRILKDLDCFKGKEIIASLKMDGENTTLSSNGYVHARSIDSGDHVSRHWVKNLANNICYQIPKGWRICGENLFAEHTIHYKNLETYFYVFSIWNEQNICLSLDETLEWCQLLNLHHVPILYRGIFQEEKIKSLYEKFYNNNRMEGYVIRNCNSFKYGDFRKNVSKFVNGKFKKDVNESIHGHWMRKIMIKNELKE